ncbi:putative protein kinase RLK-Pelle-RLCK-V family [Helianthus annuus]|nr:putative protein kinase RLK-Pelle-RLCK-V family [Helianthus annuus]
MGTFGYVAPEYASAGMLNERSDVYSFRILILEIISGRNPVDYTRKTIFKGFEAGSIGRVTLRGPHSSKEAYNGSCDSFAMRLIDFPFRDLSFCTICAFKLLYSNVVD